MVCVALLVVVPVVEIVTAGGIASSVNTTGVLAPVLPAASVSLATMLVVPSDNATEVLPLPSLPTVAVPTWAPLSYSVTVVPGDASVEVTLPEIDCFAWLVRPPAVLIATTGGTVSSVNTTALLAPVLPAASVSLATMLLLPSDSVTDVAQLPSLPTVAVPTWVPLSYNVTVVPGAASVDVT